MSTAAPRLPGDCAGKFVVEELLATGGFGAVYRARQVSLDRLVALKVLHDDVLSDSEQIARFGDEARMTASIDHPNVVRVFDHGAEEGVPWIAYELLGGRTLRERLAGAPLPAADAMAIAAQVAAGLAAAHQRGIVHRDVKPENVLEAAALWKVSDFGIARWTSQRAVRTATGVVLGTPAYMSPEIISGETPGPAADVYALGILLHELVAGQRPFPDDHPAVMLERHVRSAPPRLRARCPDAAPGLEALVLRALAKRPGDRPTAPEVIAALERLSGGWQHAHLPTAVLAAQPAGDTRAATARVATPAPAPAPAPRRAGLLAAAAVAAGLCLAAAALFWPRPIPVPPTPAPSPVPPEAFALSPGLEELFGRQVSEETAHLDLKCKEAGRRADPEGWDALNMSLYARFRRLKYKINAGLRKPLEIRCAELIRYETWLVGVLRPSDPRIAHTYAMHSGGTLCSLAWALNEERLVSALERAVAPRVLDSNWIALWIRAAIQHVRGREAAHLALLREALDALGRPPLDRPGIEWQVRLTIQLAIVQSLSRTDPEAARAAIAAIRAEVPADHTRDATLVDVMKALSRMERKLPAKR